jgi:hypothetical protein
MTFVFLVCGGRAWSDAARTGAALDRVRVKYAELTIVQGGAKGADTLARLWAEAHALPCITCYADWKRVGRGAGMARNRAMLVLHKPDGVLALPGGPGTAHMVRIARQAGLVTWQPYT